MKINMITDIKGVLNTYTKLKKNFKVRQSVNYSEIITKGGQRLMCNHNTKFQKGLFLFSMVKREVLKYIKEHGYIEPMDALPTNCKNEFWDEENKRVGMDMNNAYWTIAKLKGYISDNTYNKGLENDDFKAIRLSALSTLGKAKSYKVYEDGEYVRNELLNGNEELEKVYLDIRYSTYGIMHEIAQRLGDDFCEWKTDCIFFKDTKKNRKMVKTMIEDYGIECKIEK